MMIRRTRAIAAVLILSTSGAGCFLPDNGDHSACAPDHQRVIEESPARAFLSNAEGTAGEWVPYDVIQGRALVEADILIGDARDIGQARAIVTTGRIWLGGTVPYRIQKDLKDPRRIHRAIRDWEDKTGGLIRFVPATTEKDYVEFVKLENADVCWSHVGRAGGRQELALASGCGVREVKHEIGHLLGLWHEQSRSDRDEYVDVKWCNIEEKYKHNFLRRIHLGRDYGPYDYRSIMHYPRGAFSKNLKVTLQSLTDESICLWSRREISAGDLAAIRDIYSN